MPEISPTAKTILAAAEESSWDWSAMKEAHYSCIAAAVIRALADEVAPIEMELIDNHLQYEAPNPLRDLMLSVAEEIENHG